MLWLVLVAVLGLVVAACRSSDAGAGLQAAPLESAEVVSVDTEPPRYELAVVAQLLGSSCYSPGGYEVTRDGTTFHVRVLNYFTGDEVCTADIGYYTLQLPLPGAFVSGTEYVIEINAEESVQFTAQ